MGEEGGGRGGRWERREVDTPRCGGDVWGYP